MVEWMTDSVLEKLEKTYLLPGETVEDRFKCLAKTAASYYNGNKEIEDGILKVLMEGILAPSTPVWANFGRTKGLPISCFGNCMDDTLYSIFDTQTESAMLSKNGGGTSVYMGKVRGRGAAISHGGYSNGLVSWLSVNRERMEKVNQGGIRRGAEAAYIEFSCSDLFEVLEWRKENPDYHIGINIREADIAKLEQGNQEYFKRWNAILKARMETGEPYLFFPDKANKLSPFLDKTGIVASNLCLAPDTLVSTRQGPRFIKDLVGKEVEIYDGEKWVKNSAFKKTSDSEQLYRIHLSDGSHIDCTGEHRWKAVPPQYRMSEASPREVKTHELVAGDKLTYHLEESHGNENLTGAYLKGFMIAEGTQLKQRTPILKIYHTKYSCHDRLVKSAREVQLDNSFRSDSITDIHIEQDGTQNRSNMKGLSCRKTELLPYCTEYKKHLPSEWVHWNKESKLEFIAGLFDGDGCYMKANGGYQLASIHKQFLLDLQTLLKTLGLKATLSVAQQSGKTDFKDGYGEYEVKECWRITISSYFAHKLSNMVRFSRLSQYTKPKPKRFCADFSRVVKVEKITTKEVYCTSVPSTTFFALSNGLMTGNCNEISLVSNPNETFVCCLSSLNALHFDRWEETQAVYYGTLFLDAVMQEFIDKVGNKEAYRKAKASAQKYRALGLGVLGLHSALQTRRIPFDSVPAMTFSTNLTRYMQEESYKASQWLGNELGVPEGCKHLGRRNITTMAIAPNTNSAFLCGEVSRGIEPIMGNYTIQTQDKKTIERKNIVLKKYLQELGKDTPEVWSFIAENKGSVQRLEFLSDEDKAVFKTAYEVDQMFILRMANARAKYIDQSQSLNLFLSSDHTPNEIHELHKYAASSPYIKGLYYCRSRKGVKAEGCESCAS